MTGKINIQAGSNNEMVRVISANASFDNDLQKIQGEAYSGGAYKQWWSFCPLVTDLKGMEIAAQIPIMYNHFNDPEHRLGVIKASTDFKQLLVDGGLDGDTERGKRIIEAGKKIPWQLSHGAEIIESELVQEGETRVINGREFSGPIRHVTKSILREVSIVALGADSDTSLRIAAGLDNSHAKQKQQPKGENMNKQLREFIVAKYSLATTADETMILAHLSSVGTTIDAMQAEMDAQPTQTAPTTPAAPATPTTNDVAAAATANERHRVTAVTALLKDYPHMIEKAISAGWSLDHCQTVIDGVKGVTAGLPTNMNIIVKEPVQTTSGILEAALGFRAGINEQTLIKAHGEQVLDQADKLRGVSVKEAFIAACRMKNINVGVTLDQPTIQAGLSNTDLPTIMNNVAHKAMLQEFQAYPVTATKLCTVGDLSDYKEADRVRMTDIGDLEIVPAGGEVPSSQMGEETAKNKLDRYAKSFWLDEILIINDDLGAFLSIPKLFGSRAARMIDKVFYARLLSNPNNLFSTDNKNYLTGTTSALSLTALKAARTKFIQQVDLNGDPLSLTPKFLLVPSELEATAQELVVSTVLVGGTTATPSTNIVSKWDLEVVCSPYLDASKIANASETGWYLFGNPAQQDTFEIGYLKGQRTPIVTRGHFDLNRFGVGYRVAFPFGIREIDYRGMNFSTGVA